MVRRISSSLVLREKLNGAEVRRLTEDQQGLKVLYDATQDCPTVDSTKLVDIVAIHGIGAHPDDTWSAASTSSATGYVHWLKDRHMLPAIVPHTRIMRYGYESQWFGEEAISTKASLVSQRLLRALSRVRKDSPNRPLVFISHCFGGLVVLRTVTDSKRNEKKWPGIFRSLTGMLFFGTPFRGARGLDQTELLRAAYAQYEDGLVQGAVLQILVPGSETLMDLMDMFLETRQERAKAMIACFFEQKPSNIGAILGQKRIERFVVDETSGCLDQSEFTEKYSLARNHFTMNKFAHPEEEDFLTVCDVIERMVTAAPQVKYQLDQYEGLYKVAFSLRGVPASNKFAAREKEIEQLEDILLPNPQNERTQKILVVHGPGGVGKTQLLVRFARKNQHIYSAVFWLDGSSRQNIRRSLAQMASRIPQEQLAGEARTRGVAIDDDAAIEGVLKWLSLPTNSRWLLVFDNVDLETSEERFDSGYYEVEQYFPDADHGSVAISTRRTDLYRYGSDVKLEPFNEYEGKLIVDGVLGRQDADATTLSRHLGGLPLALIQASCYIRETNISIQAYLDHHSEAGNQSMEREKHFGPREYSRGTTLTTWTMSLTSVSKQNASAAKLFRLCAFLDRNDLWYDLFGVTPPSGLPGMKPRWLNDTANNEIVFMESTSVLTKFSLLSANVESSSFSIHPTVHDWCYHSCPEEELDEYAWLASVLVASLIPSASEPNIWELRYRLLPHALRVFQWLQSPRFKLFDIAVHASTWTIFTRLGSLFEATGKLSEAQGSYELCLKGHEHIYGPDSEKTLDAVYNLANFIIKTRSSDREAMERAEHLYQRAVVGYGKQLGKAHSTTMNAIQNLGVLYSDMDRHPEARDCFMQILGYPNPDRISSEDSLLALDLEIAGEMKLDPDALSNLATSFQCEDRYEHAEKCYQLALQVFERSDDPKSVAARLDMLNNLGLNYLYRDKLQASENALIKSLEGKKKAWGLRHDGTLNTMNNLGLLYTEKKEFLKAENCLLEVASLREEIWGAHDACKQYHNLGNLYHEQKRFADAESCWLKALKGKVAKFGEDHSTTLDTMNNLGLVYRDQCRFREAESMLGRSLKMNAKIWGESHLRTLNTMNVMAQLRKKEGRLAEAEEIYLKALGLFESAAGASDPRTMGVVYNLALLYEEQGKFADAEKYARRAAAGYEQAIGNHHQKSLDAIWVLASVYEQTGRPEDARRMYDEARQGFEKLYGPDDRRTTSALKKCLSVQQPHGQKRKFKDESMDS